MQLTLLDARPSSDLAWENVSFKGIFYLDFGGFDLFDEAKFNANMLAVEEFAKRFPNAEKVILAWTNGQMEDPQIFSDYLHRLASALPDITTPVLLCDITKEQKMEDLVIPFCKRRFAHFELLFSDQRIPIEGDESVIVVLPQDEQYDSVLFGALFASLDVEFKCIPEELLNEHWGGVDVLVVEPNSLGEVGKRMLLGFEAAGGKVRAKSFDLTPATSE